MPALLVVGSAPCAYADYDKAKAAYPDSDTMLVNGACTMIEAAEHMLSGHTQKAEEFAKARREAFPDSPIRIHANWTMPGRPPKSDFPSVTDWHPHSISTRASSAGKAARLGMLLGYDPIILCGCPMDGSGYSFDEARVSQDKSCLRIGDPTKQQFRAVRSYLEHMVSLAQTEFRGRVFSMSGFTKHHLGLPPLC